MGRGKVLHLAGGEKPARIAQVAEDDAFEFHDIRRVPSNDALRRVTRCAYAFDAQPGSFVFARSVDNDRGWFVGERVDGRDFRLIRADGHDVRLCQLRGYTQTDGVRERVQALVFIRPVM